MSSRDSVPLAGLLIIRGKKSQISRDFWRQIRGENGRFRGNFWGKFRRKTKKKAKKKDSRKKDILEGCQIQGKKENTKVHPTQAGTLGTRFTVRLREVSALERVHVN